MFEQVLCLSAAKDKAVYLPPAILVLSALLGITASPAVLAAPIPDYLLRKGFV